MINNEILEKSNYCLNCKTKPCMQACPLENDIPAFIEKIKNNDMQGAINVLNKTTILSSICGRVCPHEKQCQGSCTRGIKNKPVDIGELEAYVGDYAIKNNIISNIEIENKKEKIAIVGAGPAGLTAAVFLRRYGYEVTVFEKNENIGGLLFNGIPDFRLDKELVDGEVELIKKYGIKFKTNVEIGVDISIDELLKQYNKVVLSIGLYKTKKMNIAGENLENVFNANKLLCSNVYPNFENKTVAIIGGGNVAIDIARTIIRKNAKEVCIMYRRTKNEMPACKEEIMDAEKEGVLFEFLVKPVKLYGETNVKKIEYINTKLIPKSGEKDCLVDVENTNKMKDVDYVIYAIGMEIDDKEIGVGLTKNNYIKVNEDFETSIKNVYACGDAIGIKQTVACAARSGRDVANCINKTNITEM